MQRSFAEYLAERADWAATRAAAKAKILADRYPGVVDDFTIEEVRSPRSPARLTRRTAWFWHREHEHARSCIRSSCGSRTGVASCVTSLVASTCEAGHAIAVVCPAGGVCCGNLSLAW